MGYEDIRRLPQIELLACAAVFLASWAVPHVLLREDLGSLELVLAFLQSDALILTTLASPLSKLERIVVDCLNVRVCLGALSGVVTPPNVAEHHLPGLFVPVDDEAFV